MTREYTPEEWAAVHAKQEPRVFYLWGLYDAKRNSLAYLLGESRNEPYKAAVDLEFFGTGYTGKRIAAMGYEARRVRVEVLPP